MKVPVHTTDLDQSSEVSFATLAAAFGVVTPQDPVFAQTPSIESLVEFMVKIEVLRGSMSREDWRALCTVANRPWAAWIDFLCADPYTLRALTKPRGYAGDAAIMDFSYAHPSVADALAAALPEGQAIYAVTFAAPMSLSARQRTDLVSEHLGAMADRLGAMTVASFAAGHARELDKLSADQAAKIGAFTSIDTDALSQAEVERAQAGRIAVRSLRKSALRVRADDVGQVDFAYSMGLFDYLEKPFAEHTIRTIAKTVKPGGELLVGNLCLDAANLAYCEAVMDWWMVPRTEAEMAELGTVVTALGPEWSAEVVRLGCFYYVLARRAA